MAPLAGGQQMFGVAVKTIFEKINCPFIPIVEAKLFDEDPKLIGLIYYTDSLKEFNKALSSRAKEEHS